MCVMMQQQQQQQQQWGTRVTKRRTCGKINGRSTLIVTKLTQLCTKMDHSKRARAISVHVCNSVCRVLKYCEEKNYLSRLGMD